MQVIDTNVSDSAPVSQTPLIAAARGARLNIPADLWRDLIANMEGFCQSVRKVDPDSGLAFIVSDKYLDSQAEFYAHAFEEHRIDPCSGTLLEIGSGYGFFLAHARKNLGWNIWGIEPGQDEFDGRDEIATRMLRANDAEPERLIRCTGENISFPADSFDAVISNDVLEHVSDPLEVIRESARVLKPGGLLVFNIPNYRWIYEGHYNIPWVPSMSKPMAKRYVSLFGRDPGFLDSCNFLSRRVLGKMLSQVPELELIQRFDEGCADFLNMRIGAYLEAREALRDDLSLGLLRALYGLSGLPPFKKAMSAFAKTTGIYHEFHVIARKTRA